MLGSVLVFGLVLALIVVLQTTAIPQANAQIEFKHSERVQGDMSRLAETTSRVATTGSSSSVEVKTGVQYPTRVIFLNPPPVSGSVSTSTLGDVSLQNVEATNGETNDYISSSSFDTFETNSIEYSADYNEYSGAPETVYEGGVLYNSYDNGEFTVADRGNVVSGNRINLLLVDGQFFQSKVGSTSISVDPLSAPSRTVSVTGESGNNIIITVPTKLDASTWRNDILEGEPNVVTVNSPSSDTIEIVLDGSKTYELRMAELGVGSDTDAPETRYVTTVKGGKDSVLDSGSQELVIEVRDELNNPASGVDIPLKADDGTFEETGTDEITVTTDEDGRASVTYLPNDVTTGTTQNLDVQVGGSLDLDNNGNPDFDPNGDGTTQSFEEAEFEITVIDPNAGSAGDPGANINPNDPVIAEEALTSGKLVASGPNAIQCDTATDVCHAKVTFKKKGNDDAEITEIRFNAYIATTSPGVGTRGLPDSVRVTDQACNQDETLLLQGDYTAVPFGTISGNGGTKTLFFRFDDGGYDNVEGDAFVISVKYDLNGDGTSDTSATYIVTPLHNPTQVMDPCSSP